MTPPEIIQKSQEILDIFLLPKKLDCVTLALAQYQVSLTKKTEDGLILSFSCNGSREWWKVKLADWSAEEVCCENGKWLKIEKQPHPLEILEKHGDSIKHIGTEICGYLVSPEDEHCNGYWKVFSFERKGETTYWMVKHDESGNWWVHPEELKKIEVTRHGWEDKSGREYLTLEHQ